MSEEKKALSLAVNQFINENKNTVMEAAVNRLINENKNTVMEEAVNRLVIPAYGRNQLKKKALIKGTEEYRVIDPRFLYLGKSYSEWVSDWFNWFLSADADKRNSGPVVFLRSLGLPKKITEEDEIGFQNEEENSNLSLEGVTLGANYPRRYNNNPNIRVGGEKLQIFEGQAVLVPVIIAYEIANVPYKDWGAMQDFTGLTIDYGDNPPDDKQLTVNNDAVELPVGLKMKDFRIVTPIFTAVIPDTEFGRSVKDFLEIRVSPGSYPALVEGYFVMFEFGEGEYWVHSWASGPREVNGVYFSELLYQISVGKKKKTHGAGFEVRPARNKSLLERTLTQKKEHEELKANEVSRFKRHVAI